MRRIQVLILRVLVDPALPDVLHGSVQVVGETELHPFATGETLLALLRELSRRTPEVPDALPSGTDG